jgi:Ser/Thr protein kinase RdoA (MazF antagonist)
VFFPPPILFTEQYRLSVKFLCFWIKEIMAGGGAHFASHELARVLSHYAIGVIHQVKPLFVGNRRAPKVVVTSDQGKFLLKRRPKGKDDLGRVAFAHTVQTYLAEKAFPVAPLVPTCDRNDTILQLNNHIYEFFRFIAGSRYDGASQATIDTGRQLAKFHRYLSDFVCRWKPLKKSFHDSTSVRRHLKTLRTGKVVNEPDKKIRSIAETLLELYNKSSVHVNGCGYDSWNEQVVHGDWHPGNMLFSDCRIVAVLDFDLIRIAPAVTDLANGMLQFSIVGGRPNPADWPDYLDQAKLVQFLTGYRQVIKLDENMLNSLLDLMIETMIAEAVLPVVATGFFGNLSGTDFLKMIKRKTEWIDQHREALMGAINQT